MKTNLPKLVLIAMLLTFFNVAKALPTGWFFAQAIQVQDNNGASITNYQLQLTINTQALITAGQLNANGSDLRFGKDCDGTIMFNYWIESGLNTTNTIIWVKMDSLNALATHTIYMFYGNPLATQVSAVNGTFFGPNSSTDSVASGGAGGVANSQRGFRFAPTETILVTDFGKREPTGTLRYITLFNFTTQAIIAQTQVGGPAAQYSYGSLPNPIWLTQGTQYLLQLFQGVGDGYYFGTSSQIGQHLTYFDMKYCNSCTQNTFPTSTLTNYHYGYPDMWYYTKTTIPVLPTISFISISAPTVSITTTPSNTVCQGTSVNLTATGTGSLTWSGGVVNGVSFIPLSTQTYTVTASNACGATATSFSTITVNTVNAPTPVTASPSAICVGSSSDLNAISTGNMINWYTVPTAGISIGTTASGANLSVTPGSSTIYYAEAVELAGGSQTFSYTGGVQTFIVPPGVTSMDMECWGAQGGANWVNNINYGGYSKGTIPVTPGETLTIYVGNQPTTLVGGFNGGGAGDGAGRAGGGATDIRKGGNTLNDRVIVAGGGGGAGYWSSLHVVGGVGGGANMNGGDGHREPNYATNPGGQGGTLVSSGTGTCINFNVLSMTGGFGFGGSPATFGCGCEGYGGGGGWYGGAGSGNCRGGGGGSGYISPLATNTVATNGVRVGDGQVILTWNGTGCASYIRTPVTLQVNPIPTVTASPSTQTVCENTLVTVNGGGANTYIWSGGISNNVPFPVVGSNTYTVTGTDGNGCSNTATAQVNMNTSPSVLATVTPASICLGDQSTFSGSGAASYTWSNGVNIPTNGIAYTPSIAGTTTYTVTGTDGNGCTGTSTVDLTVNGLPVVVANALPNDTVCANELLTLYGSGASTYAWTGGVSDNTPFLLVSPTTYTVTGTDGNGCSNTESIAIHTYPAPLPITINSTPIVPEVCGTNPIILTATGGVNYSWSNGISNGVLFYPPTTNNYTVVSTDANGCTISSTVLVTVNTTTGNLALAVGANVASISGSSTTNYDQLENSHVKYYNAACNLICEMETGLGVNLGNVISQVLVSSSVLNYNGQPYVRRRFIITPTTNGPAINIILPLLQADFNTYNLASPTWPQLPTGPTDIVGIGNIRISKISGGPLGIGTATVITPTVNWNGSYWELSFPVSGLSEFYVHSVNPGNVPLPATITRFEGRKINAGNLLSWSTSNEQNNDYFNLQYSSNGIDFETIAKINTKAQNGNSSVELSYEFEHTNPQLGHNYYRLQQIDIDQHASYNAKVVDLIWSANGNTVSIYPNPTKGLVNIDLYATKAQNTTVKVLDMSGRIVKQLQAQCVTGMNALSINLDEIASGIYTIQVYENNHLSHVSKVKKED